MFDRYEAGEQAVLVHIWFSQDKEVEDLQEFETLVSSAGVEALQVVTGSRKAPHPKYFVGEGKAVEIADAVNNRSIGHIIRSCPYARSGKKPRAPVRMPGH